MVVMIWFGAVGAAHVGAGIVKMSGLDIEWFGVHKILIGQRRGHLGRRLPAHTTEVWASTSTA